MLNKVLYISLVAYSIPAQAVNWWKMDPRYWLWSTHPALVQAPVNPANHALGVFSDNAVKVVDKVDKLIQSPEVLEKASTAVSHGTTHGGAYGLLSGTASAVRDGVVAHPYATGAVLATGASIAAYRAFRPLTAQEEAEEARAKSETAAARRVKLTEDTDTELRTCLNTHARSAGSCEDKLRRCHSPARRLALLNHTRANAIQAAFREYQ